MVHRYLAADGTVDHGEERGRELDERDAALVGGGPEARHIAYDATAELQQTTLAGVTAVQHEAKELVQVVERLIALACLELENRAAPRLAAEHVQHAPLRLRDGRVGAYQKVVRGRKAQALEQHRGVRYDILADEDGVASAAARAYVQRVVVPESQHTEYVLDDVRFGRIVRALDAEVGMRVVLLAFLEHGLDLFETFLVA